MDEQFICAAVEPESSCINLRGNISISEISFEEAEVNYNSSNKHQKTCKAIQSRHYEPLNGLEGQRRYTNKGDQNAKTATKRSIVDLAGGCKAFEIALDQGY